MDKKPLENVTKNFVPDTEKIGDAFCEAMDKVAEHFDFDSSLFETACDICPFHNCCGYIGTHKGKTNGYVMYLDQLVNERFYEGKEDEYF